MHQLTVGSDFVRSLVSASVFLPTVWLLSDSAYLLMYCHANDSQEAWKAYNALITKIWPSNVNILSMSTRAVTSIAYLVYTDTQKNMFATKIQIVSNRMQNITTMSQNTTDSCINYENAQLNIQDAYKKVYRLNGCPACHVKFESSFHESSFHASILLSSLFIISEYCKLLNV